MTAPLAGVMLGRRGISKAGRIHYKLHGSVAWLLALPNAADSVLLTSVNTVSWINGSGGGDFTMVLNTTGNEVSFGENTVNAAAQLIDTDVSVATIATFNNGVLTLSGLLAEDRISIRAEGTISLSGNSVLYDFDAGPVVIGTFAGGSGASFTVTFNAQATAASVEAVIEHLQYANVSDTPTLTRNLLLSLTDSDSAAVPYTSAIPVTVTAQAEVANDTASGLENADITCNILTHDTGLSGETSTAVNGDGSAIGNPITLPSGAALTLNADGTYTYNATGAFHLVTPGTGSHNVATDSFTYALRDGSTATVTITLNGADEPGDWKYGTAGPDNLTGTADDETYILNQGGGDTVDGAGGDDTFFMQGTLDGGDSLTGGEGNDRVVLQGNHSAFLSGAMLSGIERLDLLAGDDDTYGTAPGTLLNYSLVPADGLVAAGERLAVDGSGLRAGESMTFNGFLETDGSFALSGRAGDDALTGGGGDDLFYYRFAEESDPLAPDAITDFSAGDHIAVFGLGVPGGLGISFIGDDAFGEVAGSSALPDRARPGWSRSMAMAMATRTSRSTSPPSPTAMNGAPATSFSDAKRDSRTLSQEVVDAEAMTAAKVAVILRPQHKTSRVASGGTIDS